MQELVFIVSMVVFAVICIAGLTLPIYTPPAKRPDSLDEYYSSLQGRDDENS